MGKATFDSPVALKEVGLLVPGLAPPPREQAKRVGEALLLVTFGARAAGWVLGEGGNRLVVDDGAAAVRTPVTAARQYIPAPTRRGDGVVAIAGEGDRFAEVQFAGGVVRAYAHLPEGKYGAIAELADGTVAAVESREGRVVFLARDPVVLRPRAAFSAPGATSVCAACEGRALLVGFADRGALEAWWVGGGEARVVARFEGLNTLCYFECAVDDSGERFARPDEPTVWDGDTGYLVVGLEAFGSGGVDLGGFAPPPPAPLPEVPEGLDALALPAYADKRSAPAVPGRPVPMHIAAPHVRAFVEAMCAGASRDDPDPAVVDLCASGMPAELAWLLEAWAWHRAPHLSLGEFWAERPRAATGRRALGGAGDAVRIGVIANGDEVVARVAYGAVRVVELSHEEDAEIDRGDLESFLRRCVEHARAHGEATSLDPFLPGADRDG